MDLITLTLAKKYTDSVAISGGGTSVEASTTNGNIKINGVESTVYTHPEGTNPHNTTKTDIGLSDVDNTSDINKPVSTSQAAAISLKVDKVAGSSLIPDVTLASLNSHKSNTSNPHSTSLLQLSDINIVNPTDGQKIAYDVSTSKWINTSNTVATDEKVKATSTSMASKYLDELIDNDTIAMVGDKLIVNSVNGVTKSELLTLVGMDTNIKATLNALASAGMTFKGVKNTKAELDAVVGMLLGELYIIKADETRGNLKTSYIYNGTDWLSLGESDVNVRDFTIDKLDLTSEVKNILPKANMDLTGIATSTDLANYTTTTDLSTNYALKTDLTEKANTLDVYTKVDSDGKFVEKVTGKSLVADTEITRLTGISTGANKVLDSATNGNILIDNVETNIYTHPTGTNPHNTTKSDIGLSNVDNTTDLNKPISTATQTALNGKVNTSQKGVANGVAQLNSNGVVPSSQLPSYVDDVLEYSSNSLFPATGESGKIYINTTTNITYRWTGSGYAEISPSIALGETSSTAYAGDKGKATTDKVNGHIGNTSNPHSVTKAQVGLSNVPNVATNSQTPTYTVASTNTALASGEVLSTAFGKIAKAISSLISHLADKVSHITSTERTNWNSKATQSNIDASIDKIEVGGRNLLTNTKDMIGMPHKTAETFNGFAVVTGDPATGHIDIYTKRTPILDSLEYTVSFYAKSTLENQTMQCFFYNPNDTVSGKSSTGGTAINQDGDINVTVTKTWKRYWITWKQSAGGNSKLLILGRVTSPGNVSISAIKFEKGNKATDWTPAPEDVDSAIELKADKITSGTTATRPIPTYIGQTHFDTTLGKPIWCKTVETPVWVDSTGTVC